MSWIFRLSDGWWRRQPSYDADGYPYDLAVSHGYYDGCQAEYLDHFTDEDGYDWYECPRCGAVLD